MGAGSGSVAAGLRVGEAPELFTSRAVSLPIMFCMLSDMSLLKTACSVWRSVMPLSIAIISSIAASIFFSNYSDLIFV
jgi:hypothetical protein